MTTATVRNPLSPRLFVVGTLVLCLAVTACGRRGPLDPPPEAAPENVRVPAPIPTPPPEDQRPSRPYVLDGLL